MAAITLPALTLFVSTLALGILTPGPAIIAAARSAAARGRQASMPYALGLAIGASFWCLFALFGLTVLFRVLPQSYALLRLLGGAYLLWIAFQMWRHATEPMTIAEGLAGGPGFRQGLALNLSNPKPALFYAGVILSLFPVLSTWGAAVVYLVALCVEVCFYAGVTVLMATDPMRRGYRAARTAIDRVAGTLIGALGLTLMLRH